MSPFRQSTPQEENQVRDLSPVAFNNAQTPAQQRSDLFGTPDRSARIYRTYGSKRARSFVGSTAEASSDGSRNGESSRSVSPSIALQRSKSYQISGHKNIRAPSASYLVPPPSPSPSPIVRRVPRRLQVYVEIPLRRKGKVSQTLQKAPNTPSPLNHDVVVSGTHSKRENRGRHSGTKPISIPTPFNPSDETRSAKRFRPSSPPGGLSLDEALNQAFSTATTVNAATLPTPVSPSLPAAQPDTISVPPKRRPGRPRRSRGRGLTITPVVSHMESRASVTRKNRSRSAVRAAPSVEPNMKSKPTSRRPLSVDAREEEDSEDEVASPVPLKLPRGRPRKHPLSTPSTPTDFASGSRQQQRAKTPSFSISAPHAKLLSPKHLYESVDVTSVAEALEQQAAVEARFVASAASTPKRRGRPPGSKNQSTVERMARELHTPGPHRRGRSLTRSVPGTPHPAPSALPAPVKRARGRPRKSAPPVVYANGFNPIVNRTSSHVPASGTFDYMVRLRDPDEDEEEQSSRAGPSMRRSVSVSSRHSSVAAVAQPTHYLDIKTLQWKPRARSVSVAPAKRRRVEGAELPAAEYPTLEALCGALKGALLVAPCARVRRERIEALRATKSGLLLLGESSEAEEEEELRNVFNAFCKTLADPRAAFDDGAALKALHEVNRKVGGIIGLGSVRISRKEDGSTISVVVPCGCSSIVQRASTSADSSTQPECAGEMTASVRKEIAETVVGRMEVLCTTVSVTH